MKFEQNWRFKSLESLEKKASPPFPIDESSIVQRSWKLYKIPIKEFTVDDVRFMIIQGIGLKYLIHEALEMLHKNLLTEGNYYEGDLLNAVLSVEPEHWVTLEAYWDEVDMLIRDQIRYLRTIKPPLNIDKFYSVRKS